MLHFALIRTLTFNSISSFHDQRELVKTQQNFSNKHQDSTVFFGCLTYSVRFEQEPNMSLLTSQCSNVLIKTIRAAPLSWPIRGVQMLLVWCHHLASKSWCLLGRQQWCLMPTETWLLLWRQQWLHWVLVKCPHLCLKKNIADVMLGNVSSHRFKLLKCFTNIATKWLALAILSTPRLFTGILTEGISYALDQKELLLLSLLVRWLWSRFYRQLCWIWNFYGFVWRQWVVVSGFIIITFFQVISSIVLAVCSWCRRALEEILKMINK